VSVDGKTYVEFGKSAQLVPPEIDGALIKAAEHRGRPTTARYIRIEAKNVGICPPWHKGSGGKAWLFVDEVEVNVKRNHE
jgi:hypothetical protein